MAKQLIRTAIVGYGRSAQFLHAAGLRGNADRFEIVAVTSRSDDSLQQAKQDFDCPTYTDYHTMVAEIEIDLVVLVTRNDQHCAMACALLSAGCDVLVTKPLGINRSEVDQIYTTATAAGRKVFSYQPARWGSDYRRIREVIDSGELGDVFAIRRSVFGFATRDDWQTRTDSGGGIVMNWGAHLVEPAMLLTDSSPSHVFGACAQVLNPGDAEDIFYSIITMQDGTRIHAEWSFSPKGLPNWFVQGTKGCLIAHDRELEIITGTPEMPADPTKFKDMEGKTQTTRIETVSEHIYGDPVEIYRDVARDYSQQSTFPITEKEAKLLLSILDAIKASQDKQQLITIS